jgi:hypothetical protein
MAEIYYCLRSKQDGRYLIAHPQPDREAASYLLLFREDFESLSYLKTHAHQVADRWTIESLSTSQLSSLLERWGFQGIGIVHDPLLPQIEFLRLHHE